MTVWGSIRFGTAEDRPPISDGGPSSSGAGFFSVVGSDDNSLDLVEFHPIRVRCCALQIGMLGDGKVRTVLT